MTLKTLRFFRIFLFVPLAMACLAMAWPREAQAQTTSCDPQYMDALEARAWLEAQREISMNQNLIAKPDSVLEYSCFENFMEHLANQPLFSESGCCGGTGLGATSLNTALENVVASALDTYITTNFGHSFLGGRAGFDTTGNGSIEAGVSYNCGLMQQVWDSAKCADFNAQPDHDGFFDFAWFYTQDPRKQNESAAWSTSNQCAPIISAAETAVAYNNRANLYVAATENPGLGDVTPYTDDPVLSYFNLVLPQGVTNPTTGSPVDCTSVTPIPTGVCVRRASMEEYPDAICPNPGCHYVPSPGAGRCGPPLSMAGASCAP